MDRVVKRLRDKFPLLCCDLSDDQVLGVTDGTITRALAELGCAWDDFKERVKEAMKRGDDR